MDPTAPNNNGQNPPSANPQTPIQPGQFVVAGDDAQLAPAATTAPAPPAQPTVSLAGERQPGIDSQVPAGTPANSSPTQPDPTPFAPPMPGIPQTEDPQATQAMGETPKGGGSKKVLILLAVVVLLAIIGAVAYFFVIPQFQNEEEVAPTTDIIEEDPSPTPATPGGGFGEIPESTAPAEDPLEIPPATDLPPETVVDPLTTPVQ